MKKTILAAFAFLLAAAPAVQAQKVNRSSILQKIEKSDADIADAKKNGKAATWIARGKAFYEAASAPTKDLFQNMEAVMLKLSVGEPQSKGTATILDKECEAWVYPYFVAYIQDGKVAGWKQTQWVLEDAPEKAIEAYAKAYELDSKSATKVKEGLQQVSDYCAQIGNVGLATGDVLGSAVAFAQSFDAQAVPAFGKADPTLLYYSGYLYTMDGTNNPQSFAKGAEYLNRAIDLGFNDEEGNIYYYLFHSYYGQKDADRANVMKAKEALLTGIEKFPKNERILDGLMQLYTSEEGVGDPADLVSRIDQMLAENPENIDMWFGRGRTFFALKNYDESIASFLKIVELKPDLFEGNYYLGIFYTVKGDEANTEINAKQYSSQAAYDEDLKAVNAIYMQAVPWLEKAYEIDPSHVDTLEYLKQLCFRLRDEEGMMDKYQKYNQLYKEAQAQ